MIFFVLAAASREAYDMKFGLLFSTKLQIFLVGSGLHLPGGAIK